MATRLCLVVETTTRHRDQWLDTRLNIVEPILRELLNAGGKCELALVLVGVPGLRWVEAVRGGVPHWRLRHLCCVGMHCLDLELM